MPLVQPSLSMSTIARMLRVSAVVCVGGLAAGVSPALAAFPGDNGKIAFNSDRGLGDDLDIWTMNPDGSNRVNLTAGSRGEDASPVWSADGQKILFISNRETPGNPTPPGFSEGPDFEIFVMNADGSNQRQITFNELDDEAPAWSPTGKRIAFVRDFNPVPGELDWDILTMKADGSAERNLTNTPGVVDTQPTWSPNGRKIAFTRGPDVDSVWDIYTMSPDGSRVRQLTSGALDNEFPNWSPDGTRIVFNSLRDEPLGENYEVYSMRAGGGHVTRLTFEPAAGDYAPAWSPDGRWIVFSSSRAGSANDIFTMRADGSKQRNRTKDADDVFNGSPDWQPLD